MEASEAARGPGTGLQQSRHRPRCSPAGPSGELLPRGPRPRLYSPPAPLALTAEAAPRGATQAQLCPLGTGGPGCRMCPLGPAHPLPPLTAPLRCLQRRLRVSSASLTHKQGGQEVMHVSPGWCKSRAGPAVTPTGGLSPCLCPMARQPCSGLTCGRVCLLHEAAGSWNGAPPPVASSPSHGPVSSSTAPRGPAASAARAPVPAL